MIFFKDNRIDGEYEIPNAELKGRFEQWQDENFDLIQWPFERQAGAFLMTLGTLDINIAGNHSTFLKLISGGKWTA